MKTFNLHTLRLSKIFVVLVMTISTFFTSCDKSSRETWAYYDETYCADKWTQSGNNETLKQNIIDYFKPKGVEIFDIEIFVDRDAENSSQCFNKTGRRVRIRVNKSDLDDVKAVGFYE